MSLLLRLFKSDFLDARLALSYLHKYPDSPGIQHYLCSQLKRMPEMDIEYLLPQICHMLVSRPRNAGALEHFVTTMCEASNHIAIMTLWFIQSYIKEDKVGPLALLVCKRIFYTCQAIIFQDRALEYNPSVGSECTQYCHIHAAMVGFGVSMAAFGVPAAIRAKRMIIREAAFPRILDGVEDLNDHESFKDVDVKDPVNEGQLVKVATSSSFTLPDSMSGSARQSLSSGPFPTESPSLEELSKGSAFSYRAFIEKHQQSLSVEATDTGDITDAFEFPNGRDSIVSPSKIASGHVAATAHYFHSEMQFILTLIAISDRLRTVPKHARQGTLVAELTLLNHNLPADVCIPLWCHYDPKNKTGHHRVVRLSPTDAVILNSAERVPYLIMVEVVNSSPNPPLAKQPIPPTPDSAASKKSFEEESKLSKRLSELSFEGDVSSHRRNSSESADTAEYYRRVLERRQSVTGGTRGLTINTSKPVSPLVTKGPLSGDAGRLNTPVVNISISTKAEEYSERMRTAAVMLAQLYQQQLRDNVGSPQSGSRASESATSAVAPQTPAHARIQSTDTASPGTPVDSKTKMAAFDEIRQRLLKEMTALEQERMEMLTKEKKTTEMLERAEEILVDARQEQRMKNESLDEESSDPSASVFRERWEVKRQRIRAASPYGKDPTWQLYSCIVKSGADLRQEQLALQLISEMQRIWAESDVPVWVYSFQILITSEQSGLIETIPDSISVHSIKNEGYAKELNQQGIAYTLYDYFIKEFGQPGCPSFQRAQDKFMRSLAGYSVICYILQIKDRHNGNILLDHQGHCVHIDFGFMLTNTPGSVGFEMAPFKLPQEYLDILDGIGSEKFREFRALVKMAFLALRKRAESFLPLIEIMEKDSSLPCFTGVTNKPQTTQQTPSTTQQAQQPPKPTTTATGASSDKTDHRYPATEALRERLQLRMTDAQVRDHVDRLIDSSCNNTFTRLYDSFQYYANGVL